MIKRWIKSLARRQRIARYQRREVKRVAQDQRSADHIERAREGIKDCLTYAGGSGSPSWAKLGRSPYVKGLQAAMINTRHA